MKVTSEHREIADRLIDHIIQHSICIKEVNPDSKGVDLMFFDVAGKRFKFDFADASVHIAKALREVREEEREACAEVAENIVIDVVGNSAHTANQIAKAIRARGKKDCSE